MLILTSPAKTLDLVSRFPKVCTTRPIFEKEANSFAKYLQTLSENELAKVLSVSSKIANLNHKRYMNWSINHTQKNSRPAIFTYKGDVFKQLEIDNYKPKDFQFINDSLRIMTGFYGMLRPFDLMQPYRLEMRTKLLDLNISSLADFWRKKLTNYLNKEIKDKKISCVLNVCSEEYAKAVDPEKLNAPFINIVFKQIKSGKSSIIGIHAKQARGNFINFFTLNKPRKLTDLQNFQVDGYSQKEFTDKEIVFEKSL